MPARRDAGARGGLAAPIDRGNGQREATYWDSVCLPTRTNGEIDGVMTFEVDVTERVRDARSVELAEVQLRELEERLRLALVAADIGTWDFNPINGALLRSLDSSRVLPEREQDRLPGKVEPGAIA